MTPPTTHAQETVPALLAATYASEPAAYYMDGWMGHVPVYSPISNTDREQQPYLKVAGCCWAGQHDEAGGGR